MKKEYILTFCISFLILATVVVIALMILVPQQKTVVSIEPYSGITKNEYEFKQTNSLTFDSFVREYTITDEQLNKFKNNSSYVAGNSDPFTANSSSTNNSGNSSTSGGNSSANKDTSTSTQDKITNQNGGKPNPDSSGK